MNSQQNKVVSSGVDTEFLKKEIIKLKDQEDRYNKAYGSGVFTLEQLKEYTVSVKEKVVLYESQMLKSEQEKLEQQPAPLPDAKEVVVFAREASKALQNLNFTAKKAIVSNVIERVVGTRDKLQVYGFIPVTTESNVNVLTNDRHRQGIPRHEFNENGSKLIPFRFEVDIPLLTVNHIQN